MKMMRLRRSHAFLFDVSYPLGRCQCLRCALRQVREEYVQHRQPLIPGSYVVAALFLEVLQKGKDPLERQVLQDEPRDPSPAISGNELQKEPEAISVAPNGGRTYALLKRQVLDKEAVHDLSKRLQLHASVLLRRAEAA
jgi:hypothetical protein